MLHNIKVAAFHLQQLFSVKNFVQRIFKALFVKKPNFAVRAEAKPVERSKKIFLQKLCIVICNNFCLEKIVVQRIFKALFTKKKRIVLSGQRTHPWADSAHMQSHIRSHTKFG